MIMFWHLLVSVTLLIESAIATPSFDCKKASTPVEKVICDDSGRALADSVLDYIYTTVLKLSDQPNKLKIEQKEWLKKRPENTEELVEAYDQRIKVLLSNKSYFDGVVRDYFERYSSAIAKWSKPNADFSDARLDPKLCAILSCILDSSLAKKGSKRTVSDMLNAPASEMFQFKVHSLLYQIATNKYLFFDCAIMGMTLTNGTYTAWIINVEGPRFKAIPVKVQEYNPKTKEINIKESFDGWITYKIADGIVNAISSSSHDRFSNERVYRLKGDSLILEYQRVTKDNYDNDYVLKGSSDDWIVEYEKTN